MDAQPSPHAAPFNAAAAMLAGAAQTDTAAADLLRQLDYLDGDAAATPHRVALLRAAAGFGRLFSLRSDTAPGLVTLGGEVNPAVLGVQGAPTAGVSGAGLTLRQAFEACVGEGIEYLSSFVQPGDPLTPRSDAAAFAQVPDAVTALFRRVAPRAASADWTWAADLRDGTLTPLPADLCYRRAVPDFAAPWPLSTGCGAGSTPEDATLHALLELIERDATALWWRGGVRGKVVPPGPGGALLARMRQGVQARRTWLLDITTDIAVPVVAALSCNDDGFGLCAGFACRPRLADAAEAALREMAQMELGAQLSFAKRAVQGEAALNHADRQHIRRYCDVAVAVIAAFHPLAPPAKTCDLTENDILSRLGAVRMRLETVGTGIFVLTLARPHLAVPVVRALCPALEMGLAAPPGPRLLAAARSSGTDPSAIPPL
jgi:ribosomal protein S12 methylthiotransferase accessory factor